VTVIHTHTYTHTLSLSLYFRGQKGGTYEYDFALDKRRVAPVLLEYEAQLQNAAGRVGR
jgi:hypothetical protein